ncbi:MAG: sulfatase [Planctomycetota bacterium]
MKVVFLMADTFRRDHLGAYGNEWVHTPHLDRLAAQSVLFERATIGSFPTVPNRRDTLLGHGDIGLPFNRWKPLERQEITLPERLAHRGVPSMWIGDTQNNVCRGINMNKGFTAWHLNRGQEADPMWLDDSVPVHYPVPPHLIRYPERVWHQVLINRARRRVEADWFAPATYLKAMEWLECNYRREDFFLWVDTFDPHEPWDPPPHYEALYDPGYRGRRFDAPTYGLRRQMGITDPELRNIRARYAGEVTMVDHWLGRFLATLERLGIADDTTVIFTSDHGTLLDGTGDNGLICKPNTVGADGMLMSAGRPMSKPVQYFPIYLNVARIPLLIRPAGMTRGRRTKAIVQPWDLTATLLDLFGLPQPPELIGSSLTPILEGKATKHRDVAICGTNTLAQALTPRWLYTVWRDALRDPILLDTQADPHCRRNVLADHPAVVRRLHGAIVAFMRAQAIDEDLIARYG